MTTKKQFSVFIAAIHKSDTHFLSSLADGNLLQSKNIALMMEELGSFYKKNTQAIDMFVLGDRLSEHGMSPQDVSLPTI